MKLTLASRRVQYSYEAGQEPDVPRAGVGRDVSSYGKGRAPRFALNVRIVSHHNGCQNAMWDRKLGARCRRVGGVGVRLV